MDPPQRVCGITLLLAITVTLFMLNTTNLRELFLNQRILGHWFPLDDILKTLEHSDIKGKCRNIIYLHFPLRLFEITSEEFDCSKKIIELLVEESCPI